MTVSIGSATLAPSDGANDLLRRADKALYQAKKNGRNQVISA
jgi:diguanylate cyclase (GGDEF)-like protein